MFNLPQCSAILHVGVQKERIQKLLKIQFQWEGIDLDHLNELNSERHKTEANGKDEISL